MNSFQAKDIICLLTEHEGDIAAPNHASSASKKVRHRINLGTWLRRRKWRQKSGLTYEQEKGKKRWKKGKKESVNVKRREKRSVCGCVRQRGVVACHTRVPKFSN